MIVVLPVNVYDYGAVASVLLLRLFLPLVATHLLSGLRTKRRLTAAEVGLIQQRFSKVFIGLLLTLLGLLALALESDFSHPWHWRGHWGPTAIRAFLFYLALDLVMLVYARMVQETPPQLAILSHHVMALISCYFALRYVGLCAYCLALTMEFITVFSGAVFFFALLSPAAHPWASIGLKVGVEGRKLSALVRMSCWFYLLHFSWKAHATGPGWFLTLWSIFCCVVIIVLDLYWLTIFFGVRKSRDELNQ